LGDPLPHEKALPPPLTSRHNGPERYRWVPGRVAVKGVEVVDGGPPGEGGSGGGGGVAPRPSVVRDR